VTGKTRTTAAFWNVEEVRRAAPQRPRFEPARPVQPAYCATVRLTDPVGSSRPCTRTVASSRRSVTSWCCTSHPVLHPYRRNRAAAWHAGRCAIELMAGAVYPLGSALTALPVGRTAGRTAGFTFEMFSMGTWCPGESAGAAARAGRVLASAELRGPTRYARQGRRHPPSPPSQLST